MAGNANTAGHSAPPGSGASNRRKWIIWAVVIAVLLVPATYVWRYLGSPEFCNQCHEMQPAVAGWQEGPHGSNDWATCIECHADPGFFGELQAHLNGARYLSVHLDDPPEPTDIDAVVKLEWCVGCHESAWEDVAFAEEHPTQEAPCGVCHRDVAHTNENPDHPVNTAEEGEGS